jgi:hypothetical protein
VTIASLGLGEEQRCRQMPTATERDLRRILEGYNDISAAKEAFYVVGRADNTVRQDCLSSCGHSKRW